MDLLPYFYVVTVAIAASLAALAIWSQGSHTLKVSALVLAGMLMATGYIGYVELLGRPKAAEVEWAKESLEESSVIAARLREGKAIYLWIEAEGMEEPRAYALPWSMEHARNLHRAMQQAEANGTGVRLRTMLEAERATDEPLFYAEPQEALPPKAVLDLESTH